MATGAFRTGLSTVLAVGVLAGPAGAGSRTTVPPVDLVYVDGGAIYVDFSADRPAPQTGPNETNTAAAHRRSLNARGSEPRWSPDGTRVVFVKPVGAVGSELWGVGVDGKGARRLTHPPTGSRDLHPAWSPAGSVIAFVRVPVGGGGSAELWLVQATGRGARRLVAKAFAGTPSWSPDGTQLAFDSPGGTAVVSEDGTGLQTLGKAAGVAWAPDGTVIAASCNGICLFAAGSGRLRKITSTSGALAIRWRPDSKRLAFLVCCSPSKLFGQAAVDLYIVGADGRGLQRLVQGVGPGDELVALGASWSSDAKLFAYVSTDPGVGNEIIVRKARGRPIVLGTGSDLAWRPAHTS